MLLAVYIVAFELGTIDPNLNAIPMLPIHLPLTYILGPILVLIRALPMCLVIGPVTLVHVAVRVDQAALAVRHVPTPVAHVLAPVAPDLGASAFAVACLVPLALVDSTVVQLERSEVN